MKVWGSVHKNSRITKRAVAASDNSDLSEALMECLEKIYKELDLSEPVWVTQHAKELNRYKRTVFRPNDFLESVDFDFLEIEFTM